MYSILVWNYCLRRLSLEVTVSRYWGLSSCLTRLRIEITVSWDCRWKILSIEDWGVLKHGGGGGYGIGYFNNLALLCTLQVKGTQAIQLFKQHWLQLYSGYSTGCVSLPDNGISRYCTIENRKLSVCVVSCQSCSSSKGNSGVTKYLAVLHKI